MQICSFSVWSKRQLLLWCECLFCCGTSRRVIITNGSVFMRLTKGQSTTTERKRRALLQSYILCFGAALIEQTARRSISLSLVCVCVCVCLLSIIYPLVYVCKKSRFWHGQVNDFAIFAECTRTLSSTLCKVWKHANRSKQNIQTGNSHVAARFSLPRAMNAKRFTTPCFIYT